MIRNENLHFCAPNAEIHTYRNSNNITYRENRYRTATFAALVSICLLMCAPHALADSKTKHSNKKTEIRSRRALDSKHTSSTRKSSDKRSASNQRKGSDKRSVAERRRDNNKRSAANNRRGAADSRRSNAKLAGNKDRQQTRGRTNIHETARVREVANTRTVSSNVKQTVLITPKQPANSNPTRPTLVNDIVIISEAREIPSAGNLSPMTTRSSGSGNNMPSIWPVAGAIRGGFGMRHNPFGGWGTEFHKGQDISAPYGSQVIATADGVVVIAGWLRGYGQVVYVDHGNGISTRYGHLSRIDVTVGQTIKRGAQLGLVGSTGRSTGPHLHYEVRIDGLATNPIPYLPIVPEKPDTTSPATP